MFRNRILQLSKYVTSRPGLYPWLPKTHLDLECDLDDLESRRCFFLDRRSDRDRDLDRLSLDPLRFRLR